MGPPFVVLVDRRTFVHSAVQDEATRLGLPIYLVMDGRALMDERGFTMIELLTVVLIVGILAALALPAFLGQAHKAQDSNAKADVRNAVSHMEACFAEPENYGPCPTSENPLPAGVSLTITDGGSGYSVSKMSETGTIFKIVRDASGHSRTCTQPGTGGCRSDGSW